MKAKVLRFCFRAYLVGAFIFMALYGGYVLGYTFRTGLMTYELIIVATSVIALLMWMEYLKKHKRLRLW